MIHLIVGNTGAGKTTYANQLKKENKGIIFSIDTWNNILFLADKKPTDGVNWFLERIERSEKLIMQLMEQLENSDTHAILDLGLSKWKHREKFRDFAQSKGYALTVHYLDVSAAIRWERVKERNSQKGETYQFEVTRENFDFMETWFEMPSESELINAIIVSE